MEITAVQLINGFLQIKDGLLNATGVAFTATDAFLKENMEGLRESILQNFPKEWAVGIPLFILGAASLYTSIQAVCACKKAISACVWTGVAAAVNITLLLAIKNSNLMELKNS